LTPSPRPAPARDRLDPPTRLRNVNLIPFRSGGRQPCDQDAAARVAAHSSRWTPASTVSTVLRVSPLSQARLTRVHLLLTRNPSPRRSSSSLTWVFATTTKICTEGRSPGSRLPAGSQPDLHAPSYSSGPRFGRVLLGHPGSPLPLPSISSAS